MSKQDAFTSGTVLVFNTTVRDTTAVALVTGDKVEHLSAAVKAQELQKIIDDLLKQNRTELNQIDAIAVLVGPGSYTGTRMGIVTANTLGWLLNIPLIELDGDSLDVALEQLRNNIPKTVTQITARY